MKRSKKNVAFITAMSLILTSIAALQASAANGYVSMTANNIDPIPWEDDISMPDCHDQVYFDGLNENVVAGEKGHFFIEVKEDTEISSFVIRVKYDPSVFEIYKTEQRKRGYEDVEIGSMDSYPLMFTWKPEYRESKKYVTSEVGSVYFKVKDNAAIGKDVDYTISVEGDFYNKEGEKIEAYKGDSKKITVSRNPNKSSIQYTLPKINVDKRGEHYVDISWDSVADAQTYAIYKYTDEGWKETDISYQEKDHKCRCRVTGLKYNENQDVAVIPRFNNEWYINDFSNVVTVRPLDFIEENRPDIEVKSEDDTIWVKWKKVEGATKYRVAYMTPANSWDTEHKYDGEKWIKIQDYDKATDKVKYTKRENGEYRIAVFAFIDGKLYTDYPNEKAKEVTVKRPQIQINSSYDDLIEALNAQLNKIMPPIYDEYGNKITAQNKICEATDDYFQQYVWPKIRKDPSDQDKYVAYTNWLGETYGYNGVEKFWKSSDRLVDMLYDEIIHIDKTIPVACKQIIFGDYCEDVTVTGTMGQVIVSFSGIDFIADIRDVTYDCGHWKWSWSHAGKTGLDIIGVLPVIGALKYSDQMVEINKLAKLEDIGDSAKLENRVDEIDDLLKSGKSSSEALELEKEYLSNTVSVLKNKIYTTVMEQLDSLEPKKIDHIINGSIKENHFHNWEKLVPDKDWNEIKKIISTVMVEGTEQCVNPNSYKKIYLYQGYNVEVTYNKVDGVYKVGNAFIRL